MKKNSLLNSFKNAIKGVLVVYKEERSFKIQLFISFIVFVLMFIFNISILEKGILILIIIIVLMLEMINSILERFIDILKPRVHTYVKDIKDISAGAVFIASVGAIFVGFIIFYQYILDFILKLLTK